MPGDYIPNNDLEFQDWTGNFITIANLNLSILGLTSADMTPITSDKALLDTSITDNEAKQAAAKAATKKKDLIRNATEAKARALVKRIQAKADVTADIKRLLQITVPGESPSVPPQIPLDLVARVISENTYELVWKRNGNSQTVIFIIEASFGNTNTFTQIGAQNKASFVYTALVPGQKIVFRVKADKAGIFSPYSNIAVVNDGSII